MTRAKLRLKLALARAPRLYRVAHRFWLVARYAVRVPHDPDFAAWRRFAGRDGIFLDVGANVGQSAMSFRIFNRRAPIVSIEPNPLLIGDLRFTQRIVRRATFRSCAASSEPGTLT